MRGRAGLAIDADPDVAGLGPPGWAQESRIGDARQRRALCQRQARGLVKGMGRVEHAGDMPRRQPVGAAARVGPGARAGRADTAPAIGGGDHDRIKTGHGACQFRRHAGSVLNENPPLGPRLYHHPSFARPGPKVNVEPSPRPLAPATGRA
jgi:hypothetical protein